MPADAWITLAVIVLVGVALVSERFPPTVTMGAAVVLLYLVGVVDAGEAFGGFSNIAPLTVAALYVLAGAADITGALSGLTERARRRPAPTSGDARPHGVPHRPRLGVHRQHPAGGHDRPARQRLGPPAASRRHAS